MKENKTNGNGVKEHTPEKKLPKGRNLSTSCYSNDPQVGQYLTQPQYYGHNYDYTGSAKSADTVPNQIGMRNSGDLGVRDEYAELNANRGRL
ncbi:hypothetical protein E8E14_003513 [Neopestalotiopsis sp. 37M]|nr:hypothetical protein E8E14_003513 [Neopestalotiopsis sp. 37M]